MISGMREKFKKGGFQVLIWIVLLSMVGVASLPELLKKMWGEPTEWSISVNGTKASLMRFNQKVEEQKQFINMLRAQFGPSADMLLSAYGLNADPKEMAIKTLIQELLLGNVADKINIKVDSEFANQEILKQLPPEMLSAGKVDINSLSKMLGIPAEEFKKEIENNIRTKIVLDLTKAAAYVPEFVVKNQFNKVYLKKRYAILVFPFDKYLTEVKKTQLTAQEVQSYYNAHKKDYLTQEKREGLMWEFVPENYGINVTDKEIENYYNKNKKNYIDKPIQLQVKRMVFKIADPKDTSKVRLEAQKKLEELKKGAKFEGELVEFSKGQKDADFERAAFELLKDNDISGLVTTRDGVEIIQRINKKPATFKKLEDVKDSIKETLKKERFKKLFDLDAKQVVRKAQASLSATPGAANSQADVIKDFVDSKKGAEKKLTPEALQKLSGIRNEKGFMYYTQGDKGYILELTKVTKSYIPELASIKTKIEEDIYSQKAEAKLKADLNKARNNKSFDGAKLTTWISQADNSESEMLKKEKIPAQELFKLEQENQTSDFINEKNGYLIKVDAVEPFNAHKFDEQSKDIESALDRQNIAEIEAGFIASLQKNAKILLNDKVLRRAK